MNIKEVKLIWEHELNELITATYGRPYNYGRWQEMGQDTMTQVTVPEEADEPWEGGPPSLEEWLAGEPPATLTDAWRIEQWWQTEYCPELQVVVNDLHARGLMPAGDYVMHVWW